MRAIMTHPAQPALSIGSRRFDNLRCALAWKVSDLGWRLQRAAHRFSGGDTPAPDALTVEHLLRIGDATGLRASGLVKLAEDNGRVDALR